MLEGLVVIASGAAIWAMVRFKGQMERAFREREQRVNVMSEELAMEAEYRRMAEEELELLGTFFEAQDGVIITDTEANILRVNDAFQAITGYTAREVVGHNPRMLSSGQHDAQFYAAMWRELKAQGKWSGEVWNRRKNGEIFPEWLTITAAKDKSGKLVHYVGTFSDISARKQSEEEMRLLALYDPLTKLPNRRLLRDRLFLAFNTSARSKKFGAVLFIDMDNFKSINDTMGHEMGDRLLLLIAERLMGCVREIDTVARYGGDEFVLVLSELASYEPEAASQVERITEKILAALRRPFNLGEGEYRCTASLGGSLFSGHALNVDELLHRADTAMYRAKALGRDRLCFFDPDMQSALASRLALESDLRIAVEQRQFQLYYQPQVDREGSVTGMVALLRWQHPQRGWVEPEEFLKTAETTGLILPIGRWVLEQCCNELQRWAGAAQTQHWQLAVKMSDRQFHLPDMVAQVATALQGHGVDPSRLRIELSEQALFEDFETSRQKIAELVALGVEFALEGFGTGRSALADLKRVQIAHLKIDASFVHALDSQPDAQAIIRTILAVGNGLEMTVIAEGVETEAQLDFLKRCGCWAFQGQLFGRPKVASELGRL